MKDFKDNIDEESIEQGSQKAERFKKVSPSRTLGQRVWQVLSGYSVLIVVAVAALSITLLHFQGRYLLQALRGTPLPTFWLEKVIAPKPVPDKTKVYEEALQEEAREAFQKRSKNIVKPHWQASYSRDTRRDRTAVVTKKDTLSPVKKQQKVRRPIRARKQSVPKVDTAALEKKEPTAINFFQAVKAAGDPAAGDPVEALPVGQRAATGGFTSCVVHGDQEVGNNERLTLRLTEAMQVGGITIPSGTLIYGTVRLSQNQVQVSVSRIGKVAASYQVYDHTFHAGILLDERENVLEDATRQTAYRQGARRVRELPTQVASDLARELLQRTRRRKRSVFLPDGYPLYLSWR